MLMRVEYKNNQYLLLTCEIAPIYQRVEITKNKVKGGGVVKYVIKPEKRFVLGYCVACNDQCTDKCDPRCDIRCDGKRI